MIEFLIQFECEGCRRSFVVKDSDVEDELNCPFCCLDVPVTEDDDDEDDEDDDGQNTGLLNCGGLERHQTSSPPRIEAGGNKDNRNGN